MNEYSIRGEKMNEYSIRREDERVQYQGEKMTSTVSEERCERYSIRER